MYKLGISILVLLYFGAGGSVGSIVFDLTHGRSDEILNAYGTLAFAAIANLVLLPCLWLLWRQRHVDPPITAGSSEVRASGLVLRGLPINARIAFLLFFIG